MKEEEIKKLQQALATGQISQNQFDMGVKRVNNSSDTAESILGDFIPYNTQQGFIQPTNQNRVADEMFTYNRSTDDLLGTRDYGNTQPVYGELFPNQNTPVETPSNFNYTPTDRELRRSNRFTGNELLRDANGYSQQDRDMIASFRNPNGSFNEEKLAETQTAINKDINNFSQQELSDFQNQNINQESNKNNNNNNNKDNNFLSQAAYFGNVFGAGVSLDSALFSLGQSMAFDKDAVDANGQPLYNDPSRASMGNTLRGVGSAGKLLTGGARQLVSGLGFQNRYNQVSQDYLDKRRQAMLGQQTETSKANTDFGGFYGEDGGTIEKSGETFQGYNKPKRTPNHPTKSHAVLAKDGDEEKLIRFGQQGVKGAGSNPETEKEKARRKSFKARHADNISKGKMSAAYWANKVKWEDGGSMDTYEQGGMKGDISSKVGLLMAEGYPQDQAVAIALSMGENRKYEDGGEQELPLEKRLTEQYVQELPEGYEDQANAELEDGEYVKYPDGSIQQVVGETHEKGGVDLALPDKTQILSDNLEIGKDAKSLSKEFDLSLSPKDTFADAVSKYEKKIGLTKLNKQQEELFVELEKAGGVEDEITKGVNFDYLNKKIRKIEEEKEILNTTRQEFFTKLFEKQESGKPTQEKTEFKNGGEILPMYEPGGESGSQPYTLQSEIFVDNPNRIDAPGFQSKTGENKYGGVDIDKAYEFYKQELPTLAELYKTNPGEFQKKYNESREAIVKFLKKTGTDEETIAKVVADINQTNFTDDLKTIGRGLDNLKGEYTSTRPGATLKVVTPEQQKKLAEMGVTHLSQIPSKIEEIKKANILPEDKLTQFTEYLADPELKGLDFRLGTIQPNETPDTPAKVVEKASETVTPEVKDPTKGLTSSASTVNVRQRGPQGYYFPDQSLLPPSPLQGSTLIENRRQRIDPVRVGIEDNLTELFKQQNFVASQLDDVPDSQRAASFVGLLGSTQEQANKAIASTNRMNAQNAQQAELFNISQAGAEDQMRGINMQNYERLTQTAQAKTEKDLRDYFNFNRRVGLNNYQNQQNLNLLQTMTPDYTIDPFVNTVNYAPPFDWQVRKSTRE